MTTDAEPNHAIETSGTTDAGAEAAGGDVVAGMTGHAAPEVIQGVLLRAAVELGGIAGELRALWREASGCGWEVGVVRECAELVEPTLEVLVAVGNRIGVGGAAIRAAYFNSPGVGGKPSLVGSGTDGGGGSGDVGSFAVPAGAASGGGAGEVVVPDPAGPEESATDDPDGAAGSGDVAEQLDGTAVAGTPPWRFGDGPVRRCTAPLRGRELCVTCATDAERAACPRVHDPDDLEMEWAWWPSNLDGYVDPETSYAWGDAEGPDDTMGAPNVERLLVELHGCCGPVVVRELATGDLWTLDELRANYPGAVLTAERIGAVEARKAEADLERVSAQLDRLHESR